MTGEGGSKVKRNPKWSRDEILVTLDFYFKYYPTIPEKTSSQIEQLSDLLRSLSDQIGNDLSDTYRNSNGVHMKLMNFHHFNDQHKGQGLKGGSKLDEEIFREFENNQVELRKISLSIQSWIKSGDQIVDVDLDDDELEVQECRLLTRVHRTRERDRKITQKKKDKVRKELGTLRCECCGFDFEKTYGQLGDGFIECHHIKPISEIIPGEKTSLDDLSLVCSNCHRMIHRKRPWLSISELRKLIS